MSTNFSFQLGLINSCLGFIANALAWPLTAYFGRRNIYLYGTAFNVCCLIALGIAASVPQNTSTNYAQACLGIIISFVFALAMGPISYTIIAETSAVRLRALSTGVGRAAYYVAEIPMIYREFAISAALNNSCISAAEPDGVERRRQMRLRMGRYRHCMLHPRLLLPARDEAPKLPRDRHSLCPTRSRSKVQDDYGGPRR